MPDRAPAARDLSPRELKERIDAQREGVPLLAYRKPDGAQVIVALRGTTQRTIGRGSSADIGLDWDDQVSRVHAVLERLAGAWTVVDDGLSQHGSYVNRERVSGRRRLQNRDVMRFGNTEIVYLVPQEGGTTATATAPADGHGAPALTAAQRRVLVALCRPLKDIDRAGAPATNQQIADELHLSVDAVKTHMKTLFARLAVDDLPQNQKRAELARRAFETGAVSEWEL